MMTPIEIVWRQPGFWGGCYSEIPSIKNISKTLGYPIKEQDGFLYIVQSVDEDNRRYTNIQSIPLGSIIERRTVSTSQTDRMSQIGRD